MATRELIDIILRLRKEGTGVKDAEKELSGLEKTIGKTKSGFEGLGPALTAAAGAIGAATAAFYTLKKAYDFGKEGTKIAQTAESFDRLMDSMGVAPGVLGRLRDASRDTVDDMTLMSSTLALLAGTSEEVGGAIMEAAPRLLEIAGAAHKLNPELGDTAYLYKSLALGIKRASPMILDNLGLTIKVGEATDAYAASLGKTADELTAEERQMALLNGALEAGDRLIQQVGGSTETMGDSFAQAEAQWKNFTDTLKTKAAPVMGDLAGQLTNVIVSLTGLEEAQEDVNDLAIEGADSYEEYLEVIIQKGRQAGTISAGMAEQFRLAASGADEAQFSVEFLSKELGILTEEQYNSRQAFDTLTGGMENFTTALDPWIERAQEATETTYELDASFYSARDAGYQAQDMLEGMVDKAQAAAAAERDAAAASDEFKESMDLLDMAIRGEVGEAIDDHKQKLADLKQQLKDGELTQREYNAAVKAEAAAFEENNYQLAFNIAQKQILDALEQGLIEDTNASGTAFDEANTILWTLAETLGLTDEKTLAFQGKVQDLTGAMIDGRYDADEYANAMRSLGDGAVEASGEVDKVGNSVRNLPESKEVGIHVHTRYTSEGTPPVQGGHEQGPYMGGYQVGGQFVVRGPAGPDRVPVQFMATRGEVVTVTPVGGIPPANPVTNNFNLNVTSTQPSMGIMNDFNIMQAMAG